MHCTTPQTGTLKYVPTAADWPAADQHHPVISTHLCCKVCYCFGGNIAEREVGVYRVVKLYAGCCMYDVLDFRQQALLVGSADAALWLSKVPRNDLYFANDLQAHGIC